MSRFLIATRRSAMALAQTELVRSQLERAVPTLDIALAENDPRGDRDQISRLDRHGGKGGAFVAEIRADVLSGRSQCAMHSLKDMPGNEETPGLVIGAYLKREDPTDALVLREGLDVAAFETDGAKGQRVGTNSVRRAALVRKLYPHVEVIHFRGAADTRVKKLDERIPQKMPDGGETPPADAILLATAGLHRVGLAHRITRVFSTDEMLPAVGQGIIAVECAEADWRTREFLSRIDDPQARLCADAEREVLWVLDGHCNSPIAAHARIDGDTMDLKASVMTLDGDTVLTAETTGEACYPRELGRRIAVDLLNQGADRIIAATRI